MPLHRAREGFEDEAKEHPFVFRRRGHQGQIFTMPSPPQPKDVLASYKVSVPVFEHFHGVTIVAPELVPRTTVFLVIQVVCMVPVVVLGWAVFIWGRAFGNELSRGHVSIASPSQIQLQPAFGTVVMTASCSRQADATMVEPLMLSPPSVSLS
mmetsp:Transcript_32308/g.86051  ORF Transcript_32308/g.86051 Transcript_32308/m.86051 type:complete len:153 (+) Transcript_32308:89-547(+)